MTYFRILLLLGLVLDLGSPAAAQRDQTLTQPAAEQRRAQLRSVLKSPHAPTEGDAAADLESAGRRLSAQERSDLRQQLRQQRSGKRGAP